MASLIGPTRIPSLARQVPATVQHRHLVAAVMMQGDQLPPPAEDRAARAAWSSGPGSGAGAVKSSIGLSCMENIGPIGRWDGPDERPRRRLSSGGSSRRGARGHSGRAAWTEADEVPASIVLAAPFTRPRPGVPALRVPGFP